MGEPFLIFFQFGQLEDRLKVTTGSSNIKATASNEAEKSPSRTVHHFISMFKKFLKINMKCSQ